MSTTKKDTHTPNNTDEITDKLGISGLQVVIHLSNGFRYSGTVLEELPQFLRIDNDVTQQIVIVRKDAIRTCEVQK